MKTPMNASRRFAFSRLLGSSALCACLAAGGAFTAQAFAQDSPPNPANLPTPSTEVQRNKPVNDRPDPTTRPRSEREVIDSRKALKQELKGSYKQWLEQDVKWIITDEETKSFKSLSNDEERDRFIENFWLRRNPNPDSPENEFREEHYARIAYSNEHFAAGKAGWRTDRGHIYIAFGKPDSIDSHPSGGSYDRPIEEGGGNTSTFPFEIWHYRYLEGIGDNIDIEFVDTCMCGDYHMTIDRSEKDALLHVPGAGLTLGESLGQSSKADRFSGGGLENLGKGIGTSNNESKQFDRLETFAKLQAAPVIKFKDLEGYLVQSKILSGTAVFV